MNTLMLVALAVVLFCYCGGKYCPSVLKQNKEMLLGVLVGMALCSFAGLRLEGFDTGVWQGLSDRDKINLCRASPNDDVWDGDIGGYPSINNPNFLTFMTWCSENNNVETLNSLGMNEEAQETADFIREENKRIERGREFKRRRGEGEKNLRLSDISDN